MKDKSKVVLTVVLTVYTTLMTGLAVYYYQEEQRTREIFQERQRIWEELQEEVKRNKQEKELTDWQILQMAIVMTESRFDPEAVGKSKDWGIFQITPIYVKELNRIQDEVEYSHEDAFDVDKAIEMFNLMQEFHNPAHNFDTMLRYHNKAEWYRRKVEANVEFIENMERVRRSLRDY